MFAAGGLLVGLVVGFAFANSVNRRTPQARATDGSPPLARQELPVSAVKEQQPFAPASRGTGAEVAPGGPPQSPAGNTAAPKNDEKPEVATPEYDAQIAAAEPKARRPGATPEEKRAAAEAFFRRGYFYYTAQNPRLYKFALGDFRRALRYQPDNEEARELVKQIEDIYRYSVKKPIPTNGLEP